MRLFFVAIAAAARRHRRPSRYRHQPKAEACVAAHAPGAWRGPTPMRRMGAWHGRRRRARARRNKQSKINIGPRQQPNRPLDGEARASRPEGRQGVARGYATRQRVPVGARATDICQKRYRPRRRSLEKGRRRCQCPALAALGLGRVSRGCFGLGRGAGWAARRGARLQRPRVASRAGRRDALCENQSFTASLVRPTHWSISHTGDAGDGVAGGIRRLSST